MQLTESEKSTLVNGLCVAANKFDESAKVSLEAGYPMLVEQFERQAKESRELASKIEGVWARDIVEVRP